MAAVLDQYQQANVEKLFCKCIALTVFCINIVTWKINRRHFIHWRYCHQINHKQCMQSLNWTHPTRSKK